MQQAMTITWQRCTFSELSGRQLYALLAARQAVFIIEQNCLYPDIDGLDVEAEHLIAWSGHDVAACLRILSPGAKYAEASLGRILTTREFRGTGVGRELMAKALAYVDQRYPAHAIRIGAQAYLEGFYGSFGFQTVSAPYVEDGIPHVEMLRERLAVGG